ncbi:sigma-54-dependent Fis family transcriptional regulator [Wenzhouxiangella sp. AB-CW3]|uniref:sigma-54-dependent transcriptional regulator n=1 Tax=Wenzhouxiangella sp. AB-CW3 TaxID=2771012 RepID=UPI00168AAC4F|nr:sigma-54 dependent transcriptional regulator [Wenzhouxiangella sp. AB-CW3]QOC22191.1 sigma-54-dependent Fis family transcriptional regulator [Wenzhouxiangella sp. AB-CW3]
MDMKGSTIIVADDQADVRQALRLMLKKEGCEVVCVASPEAARARMTEGGIDLALLDLNYSRDTTSGREGLTLIEDIRTADPETPLVAMTAWGSVEVAVEALKAGASDFIEKPWDNVRLLTVIRSQLERARACRDQRRFQAISEIQRDDSGGGELVAEAPAMKAMLETVGRVASADVSVLITGENGTGKSLVAEMLHRRSLRAGQAFVAVNMGSIPEHLFESEMFGHLRGAFTDAREDRIGRFELADGGTLFLDEIGNLPESQQAKLLHVLESGQFERVGGTRTHAVDMRVIAATNADLPERVRAGAFRQDLYFRLNTIEIRVPPLRERCSDIPLLARHFLQRHGRRYGRSLTLSDAAEEALTAHDWPGNVRELSHVIERVVLLGGEDVVEPQHLSLDRTSLSSRKRVSGEVMPLMDAEQLLIRNALDRFGGNVEAAAQALGLSRSALYRRLQKFGIDV